MEKKIYHISGFDCASCATKAEKHIAKQSNVEYAHLDYAGNKLYVTFRQHPWSIDELVSIIKEVESDPLQISEENVKLDKFHLFNKKMWWQLIRVIGATLIALICIFLLGNSGLNWLRFSLYCIAIVFIGYDIFYKVILNIKNKSNILDHNLLILIATIGSLTLSILGLTGVIDGGSHIYEVSPNYHIAIDETMEAVLVMVLFQIGSIVESVASNKSKYAIKTAIELRVETANLYSEKENSIRIVKSEDLVVGDKIIVNAGEKIPVDGIVYDGEGFVDTSSLTGEFVPVLASYNNEVFAGCLLKSGNIKVEVCKPYKDSSVNKIIELITNSGEKKSRADMFVASFARIYTPIICALALLTFILGFLISKNWPIWLHASLEILVIGCPCSIVISVPLAYFSGIGLASKNGIVVKGGNYLDEVSRLGKLITDKTGTLTNGNFQIVKTVSLIDENEFMNYLYAVESLSKHPIALAICHDVDISKLAAAQDDFIEQAGLGCSSTYNGHHIIAGNTKLFAKFNVKIPLIQENGTVVYLGLDNNYIGYVVLDDTIKEESFNLVKSLHKENVEIVLLTGDKEDNARNFCEKLGIDRYYSNLLPENKTEILEKEMQNCSKNVAFVGDGINDAPSIRRSDVGIAMGGIGSDLAVSNADIVLMNDNPKKIYDLIKISRKTRNTAIFNIAFALVVKFTIAILAIVFPNLSFMMYIAVFADTGLTILLTINSFLLLHRKI